jgi:hypothetical protein
MDRRKFLYTFLFTFFTSYTIIIIQCYGQVLPVKSGQLDQVKENQIIYNGKVWRNQYAFVKGDQFLFSKDLLAGTVSVSGKTYNNLSLNYDIYNDEILISTNRGTIIQLNKEIVDSFTLNLDNKTYRFFNTETDKLDNIKGYVKVLYKGKSFLYVKYKKEIQPLAVDDKYDLFFRTYRVYFVKGDNVNQISSKNELLKVLMERKAQVKDFMKKNKLKVTIKDPESFIPVIRYYDSLGQ